MSIAEIIGEEPSHGARGKAPKSRRGKAKPTKARRPKSPKPTKAKTTTAPTPKITASSALTWIAEYIYAGADGSALIAHLTVTAKSAAEARAIAAANPPAPEFMVTIHRCSDEQILGQVRHRALAAAKAP